MGDWERWKIGKRCWRKIYMMVGDGVKGTGRCKRTDER
jgi:hypothetical protein